ncbi:hypothetical protein [Meridianimarinicoccus aquatilis]|nr:hypothetical protein [Fluviibacterium aquatile]QIE42747.1 hypothetical protein G5B39_12945 [Rhodobacteraceae bacterium SC52]
MIRLVIYVLMFSGGLWAGSEYERVTAVERCLNAGGSADPRGFCIGPQQ